MRIDLSRSVHRSFLFKLLLGGIRLLLGTVPGPVYFMSWRKSLFHNKFLAYGSKGMTGKGPWSRGEAELLATFVSRLNSCHF